MKLYRMAFFALIFLSFQAQADDLYLSLGIQNSRAVESSDIEAEGDGMELTIGYYFSPEWAFELTGMVSDFQNDFIDGTLTGGSLNVRFSPFAKQRFQPYLKGGLGFFFLEEDYADEGLAGPAAILGAGSEFFLVPGLSIGADATWRFIRYTDEYFDGCCGPDFYDLDDELDGTTFSGGVTLTYHFR